VPPNPKSTNRKEENPNGLHARTITIRECYFEKVGLVQRKTRVQDTGSAFKGDWQDDGRGKIRRGLFQVQR